MLLLHGLGTSSAINFSIYCSLNYLFLIGYLIKWKTAFGLISCRHCLWILGNERAITNNENVWKAIVLDAKNRKCFFNADQDEEMVKAILDSKKKAYQFDDLLDTNSVLFRSKLWKVYYPGLIFYTRSFINFWLFTDTSTVLTFFFLDCTGNELLATYPMFIFIIIYFCTKAFPDVIDVWYLITH